MSVLDDRTVADLRDLANDLGVDHRGLRKEALIDAIRASEDFGGDGIAAQAEPFAAVAEAERYLMRTNADGNYLVFDSKHGKPVDGPWDSGSPAGHDLAVARTKKYNLRHLNRV